jgi:hypothetical protein
MSMQLMLEDERADLLHGTHQLMLTNAWVQSGPQPPLSQLAYLVACVLGATAGRLSFHVHNAQRQLRWFGRHSFPAKFQKMITEKGVLPALEAFVDPGSVDMVLILRRMMRCAAARAVCCRPHLWRAPHSEICSSSVMQFEWCGVLVDSVPCS